jgi:uncharacterized protein (DUF983 family)
LLVRKKLSKTQFGFCEERIGFNEGNGWKIVIVILVVIVIIVGIFFDGR